MKAEVSIVLVTYNRQTFLPRTIESILSQTYGDFELLICDDCSSDDTRAVCHEYARKDSRIRYYRNMCNVGMPDNLNAGIRRTHFEFIANLHDGDIYHPNLLERWRAALLNNPSAGFVFNIYRHLAADGTLHGYTNRFPSLISGHDFLEDICFKEPELECPVWGTVMARRGVYDDLGLFDHRYSFWSDFDMWFRIAEQYDIAFVPEPLIDLPSKDVMPHLFGKRALACHATIFKMFWKARCRHYRRRPARLARELGKQVCYFTHSRIRRAVRRLLR